MEHIPLFLVSFGFRWVIVSDLNASCNDLSPMEACEMIFEVQVQSIFTWGYIGVILGLYRGHMGLYWGYILNVENSQLHQS